MLKLLVRMMNSRREVLVSPSVRRHLSFVSRNSNHQIGVDFKVKMMDMNGKKLNLRIWDTGRK